MIGCFFNPAGCVADWFASIPLEWLLGAAFVAGLIVGAILGKWAVAALLGVLGGVAAFRWMGGRPVSNEEQYGEPEVRNVRKTRNQTSSRTYNPDTGEWK